MLCQGKISRSDWIGIVSGGLLVGKRSGRSWLMVILGVGSRGLRIRVLLGSLKGLLRKLLRRSDYCLSVDSMVSCIGAVTFFVKFVIVSRTFCAISSADW